MRLFVVATVFWLLLPGQSCADEEGSAPAPEEVSTAAPETKPASLAEGYALVKEGMSQAEVRDLLGEPDEAPQDEVAGLEC